MLVHGLGLVLAMRVSSDGRSSDGAGDDMMTD